MKLIYLQIALLVISFIIFIIYLFNQQQIIYMLISGCVLLVNSIINLVAQIKNKNK